MSQEIQQLVTNWYSKPEVWAANAATYPKSPNYIDCKLLNIPCMVTDKRVLNLGCCYPSDELQFSETAERWFAIDISPEIIRRCKELVHKPNVFFYVMDMKALAWKNDYFHTVIDFSSGDHLTEKDYKIVLNEAWRVIDGQGRLVITYANLASFPEKEYYGDFGYFRATDPTEMRHWVEDAGFIVYQAITEGDRVGLAAEKAY